MRFLFSFRPVKWAWVHLGITLFVSLAAGAIISLQRQQIGFSELIYQFKYYYSTVLNGAAAFILIWYIFMITNWLNERDAGFKLSMKRITDQVRYGIGLGAILEMILATILYTVHGRKPLSGSFFYTIFIMAMLYVSILNLIYFIYSNILESRIPVHSPLPVPVPPADPVPPVPTQPVPPKVRYKILKPKPVKKELIAKGDFYYIFYRVGVGFEAYNSNGISEMWLINLNQTYVLLKSHEYFRIDKGVLIHWKNVRDFEQKGKELHVIVLYPEDASYKVSRRNVPGVKKWYDKYTNKRPRK